MVFADGSLTVVLLGDWNKFYLQPDWIASNVYEKSEIELGVKGQGIDVNVTYRCDGVIIAPSQSQMLFTAENTEKTTVEKLVRCVNNFLQGATTPVLNAYGFNCEYVDSDGSQFADIIDAMGDNSDIISCGYEIKASKVIRTLAKDERILNLESSLDGGAFVLHFNEHYGTATGEMPDITVSQIEKFLEQTSKLIRAFGYEIEDDE